MTEATIGHNRPPLSKRIFAPEEGEAPSIAEVLEAVRDHVMAQSQQLADDTAKRSSVFAANVKRLPEALDDTNVGIALDLFSAAEAHGARAKELREEILGEITSLAAAVTAMCKPMDAGISSIDKALRPLLERFLLEKLDAHNNERSEHEPKLASITQRAPSDAKVTLTDGYENVVTDPAALPRDLLVPDQKAIDKAIDEGREVPGIERKRKPSLRMYK